MALTRSFVGTKPQVEDFKNLHLPQSQEATPCKVFRGLVSEPWSAAVCHNNGAIVRKHGLQDQRESLFGGDLPVAAAQFEKAVRRPAVGEQGEPKLGAK